MIRCRVCAHPDVATADAMIVAGRANREVARVFGLSRWSVDAHVTSGHVPVPAAVGAVAPGSSGGPVSQTDPDALDPVTELRAQLARLNALQTDSMSASARINLAVAQRQATEALQRAAPSLPPLPPPTPDLEKLMELFDAAFADHPAVIRPFVDEWRRYRGMDPAPERDFEEEKQFMPDGGEF